LVYRERRAAPVGGLLRHTLPEHGIRPMGFYRTIHDGITKKFRGLLTVSYPETSAKSSGYSTHKASFLFGNKLQIFPKGHLKFFVEFACYFSRAMLGTPRRLSTKH